MNLHKYLSAAQVAELSALNKKIEEANNIKLKPIQLKLSSLTLDPAHANHVWGKR